MGKIVVVPPAAPGNFGDLATIVATKWLFPSRKVVILDLFSGLDNGMQNWAHYSDLVTLSPEELSSVDAESLVFIAQDTLDGRFGEFHLEKLRQSIEILESNSTAGDLRVAVWNITAEENSELGQQANWLLSRASQIIARDSPGYKWISSHGFEVGVAPDLAAVGISESLVGRSKPSTNVSFDLLSLGWQVVEHFEEIKIFLEDNVRPSVLEIIILDERIYRHQLSDHEVALKVFSELDINCWIYIHSLGHREKVSTISHLSSMVTSISSGKSFTTSRYHPAIARMLAGKQVDVVAYNSKLAGLESFGRRLHRESSGVIVRFEPSSKRDLPNFRRIWQVMAKNFLAPVQLSSG